MANKNSAENGQLDRRRFIANSAIALTGTALNFSSFPLIARTLRSDVIHVGLIGSGMRGTGLARTIQNTPGLSLVACCDVVRKHAESAAKYGIKNFKIYSEYKKLLEDKDIDAVVIATPLYLHHQMAVDALSAGKHVYLEKIAAYNIPQVLDLTRKVMASDLIFQVGFQYRYFGLYHKIKRVLAEKWAGTVTHLECQYNRNSNWRFPVSDPKLEHSVNWRMYRAYSGGPLAELCAHQIDAVNFMLDAHPQKVIGIGGIDYWKDGRETFDNIRTIYEYPEGIKVSATSVLSNAYDGYNIRILGDKATIEIQRDKAFIYAESTINKQGTVDGVTGATIAATTQGKGVEISYLEPGEKAKEPTQSALIDFASCIVNNRKPISNIDSARDVTIAIHMGNAAADTETIQRWKPEYSI